MEVQLPQGIDGPNPEYYQLVIAIVKDENPFTMAFFVYSSSWWGKISPRPCFARKEYQVGRWPAILLSI